MLDARMLTNIAAVFGPEQKVTAGKWFGKPCLKADGKVFATLWEGDMAFKLTGKAHTEALRVEGARSFDPRGRGHPMKEWVQIPACQSSTWGEFAQLAYEYVAHAAQVLKDQVISDLIQARQMILGAALSLSSAQQDEVFLTLWSVRDMLSHLVGWDYANLEAVRATREGKVPAFYAHYDANWRTFNARLVAQYRLDNYAELLESVQQSHQQLIDYLRTVPADEFDKDYGVRARGWKVTVARLMQVEAKDERKHYQQIVEFARRHT